MPLQAAVLEPESSRRKSDYQSQASRQAGHAHQSVSDFLVKKLSAQGHKPTDEHLRKIFFYFSYLFDNLLWSLSAS